MRTPLFVAAALLVSVTASAQGPLTDDAVAAAIKAGEARKFNQLVSDCVAGIGFGGSLASGIAAGLGDNLQPTGSFNVVVSRNEGRIAYMAANAKRLYKTVTVAQITSDLREPAVFVTVDPQDPSRSGSTFKVAAPVERVVLKSKVNEDIVAQPTAFETEPVEWKNLLGATFTGTRALARFAEADVRELPAGDFDVVVVTTAGERRCKVGKDDRVRLFGK